MQSKVEISTISTFASLTHHTLPHTLVALDLDDTVLRLDGAVGAAGWWQRTFNHHYARLRDYDSADEAALQEWMREAALSQALHTDEAGLRRLLAEAREAGNAVVALTARDASMQAVTEQHLDTLGVALDDCVAFERGQHAAMAHNAKGVFYAGEQPKASALLAITDCLRRVQGRRVDRVLFVDDLLHNVQGVLDALAEEEHGLTAHCFLAKML
eukprot:gnl/Hemi2/22860_TR7649_c0_g1_i1.p1 gnl/Hemi2/22860_TR7649_c0_g1~~gnl/Hemi2/22860_TR7649_c0_g1_i1.p1  ORF type:complete len:214 (-),score=82.37 gnl/Hemi2/22860_TR7649_c0_g1_i1:301-942(-)